MKRGYGVRLSFSASDSPRLAALVTPLCASAKRGYYSFFYFLASPSLPLAEERVVQRSVDRVSLYDYHLQIHHG